MTQSVRAVGCVLVLSTIAGCGLSIEFLTPQGGDAGVGDSTLMDAGVRDVARPPDAAEPEDAGRVDGVVLDGSMDSGSMDSRVQDAALDSEVVPGCGMPHPGLPDMDGDGIPDLRDPWSMNCNPAEVRTDFATLARPVGWVQESTGTVAYTGSYTSINQDILIRMAPLTAAHYVEARFDRQLTGQNWVGISTEYGAGRELKCQVHRRVRGVTNLRAQRINASGMIVSDLESMIAGSERTVFVSIHRELDGTARCRAFSTTAMLGDLPLGMGIPRLTEPLKAFADGAGTHNLFHVWVHQLGPVEISR